MMSEWIKGDSPSEAGWYWVTVKDGSNTETYRKPLNYDGGWNPQVNGTIIAFMPITSPQPYSGIGNGTGYYIKIEDEVNGTYFLGWGLNHSRWEECRGYDSVDNALTALKRYRKRQVEKYPYVDIQYSVVAGSDGSVVWTEEFYARSGI